MASRTWLLGMAAAILALGCNDAGGADGAAAPLEAVCADDPELLADGDWVCPDPLTVECDRGDGTADVDYIYVVVDAPDAGPGCDDDSLSVSDPGPFAVGDHTIVVSVPAGDAGAEQLCEATLTVVDTEPPVPTEHTVTLWPPNHSMHEVRPEDCVSVEDRCAGVVDAHFTWARCDEPMDAMGDGHHEPDVTFDEHSVHVRAERQGGGDGRVYRLGYMAHDGAGNVVEGSCAVVVPHDQSGADAVEGPPAYEMMRP